MNVVIRVDASTTMGTGHLMRCRTLARALQHQGADIAFVCRHHPGNRIGDLREEGFIVHELPTPDEQRLQPDDDYATWLGVPQAQDAAETKAALADKLDWLIVDHYALDREWEQRLRACADRVVVIDDLANRDHDCDVLLDQNYATDPEVRYDARVPPEAIRMLGPRYALLQPEYAAYRAELTAHSGQVRRIFIFFGGTDSENLTEMSLQALADSELHDVAVDAIVGPNNPNREALAKQAEQMPHVTLHSPRPHLADLMANANLAIGAGGTTTWERCCLGLPSVVVSIADNQRPSCRTLADDGLIFYAGHVDQVSIADLRRFLAGCVVDPEALRAQADHVMATVDGEGAARVAQCLFKQTGHPEPIRHET